MIKIKHSLTYYKWPILIGLLWCLTSVLSVLHLLNWDDQIHLPNYLIGLLGWGVLLLTLFYIAKDHITAVTILFVSFFVIAYSFGVYLEPPSDPLEHLRRIYSYCGNLSHEIPKQNKGFWHYNMLGVGLCYVQSLNSPTLILYFIEFIAATVQALLVVMLFLMGKSSGLPHRWAIFSVLVCFLFFGTGYFSFFNYYALGASALSILLYWLWITVFFFKNDRISLILGCSFAILLIPILLVNHKQEVAFLLLVVGLWVLYHANNYLWKKHISPNIIRKIAYFTVLVFLFGLLPQYSGFLDPKLMDDENVGDFISNLAYNWRTNQYLLINWFDWYPVGNFFSYRVGDSLGFFGYLPVALLIFLLTFQLSPRFSEKSIKIFFLGLLPLIVFVVPLFSFIWISNIRASEAFYVYWRIVYATVFWLPLAWFLFQLEKKFIDWDGLTTLKENFGKYSLFSLSVIIVVIMSFHRNFPIYGKFDFMALNSSVWWEEWKPIIIDAYHAEKTILTDPVTSLVLHDVFNLPSAHTSLYSDNYRPTSIDKAKLDMRQVDISDEYHCILNFKGFQPSWVPSESGHWEADISDTIQHYVFDNASVIDSFPAKINETRYESCVVFD